MTSCDGVETALTLAIQSELVGMQYTVHTVGARQLCGLENYKHPT